MSRTTEALDELRYGLDRDDCWDRLAAYVKDPKVRLRTKIAILKEMVARYDPKPVASVQVDNRTVNVLTWRESPLPSSIPLPLNELSPLAADDSPSSSVIEDSGKPIWGLLRSSDSPTTTSEPSESPT